MTRRPGLTAEAIAAEVERLFAVYPPRDDDHAFHRRYLRNCVRSGVEPYRVSERARQHIADVLARADADIIVRARKGAEASGLSREQLAVAIGRTFDSVASYEWGRMNPPVATLRAIARALDTTASALLEGTDDESGA